MAFNYTSDLGPAEMAVLVAFGGVVAGAAVQSLRDELREFI